MSNSKSIKLTINGKAYTSLSDIARRNNLPINTVYERYARYKKGDFKLENLDKPLQSKTKILPNGIIINGIYYKDNATLAKAAGISEAEMYWRLSRYKIGKMSKDALLKPLRTPKSIVISGKYFNSIKEAAQYCNINEHAFRARLQRLGKDDPKVLRKVHNLRIDGQCIKSLPKWCNKNHLNYEKVQQYIKQSNYKNLTTEKIRDYIQSKEIKITINGKAYKSLTDLASDYNLNRTTVIMRFKAYKAHKISKEDIITQGHLKGYHYVKQNVKPIKQPKIIINEKPYMSITDIAKDYNLSYGTVYARLKLYKEHVISKEDIIMQDHLKGHHGIQSFKKLQLVINDKLYTSITDIAKDYNLSYSTVYNRLKLYKKHIISKEDIIIHNHLKGQHNTESF